MPDGEPHHRKANRAPPMRECSIFGGRCHQRLAFSRADSLQWRPERIAGSSLHLHHDELRAAPADQVQLAAPGGETRSHDLVATLLKQVGRSPLSGPAELYASAGCSRNGAHDVR